MTTGSRKPLGRGWHTWWVDETTADLTRPALPTRTITLATTSKTLTLDLAKSALIVVDMQNDFCHPDGWLASIGVDVTPARQAIPALQTLLPVWRHLGIPVIWVNWGNRPDLANISPSHLHVYNPSGTGTGLGDPLTHGRVLTKGEWGASVVEELVIAPEDLWVDKFRMSGFWDTPLDSILKNLGCTTLFFGGVNADQCVLTTLQDANFLGYDCILLEDCTATTSPEYCLLATLYNVRQCFGFVSHSQTLLGSLGAVSV